MTNMSYCRFQNTIGDMQDCIDHLNDPVQDDDERHDWGLSEEEDKARKKFIKLCEEVAKDYGHGD